MRKANLCLHSGANECSMDSVRNSLTPGPTDSHFPIPHEYMVDQVRNTFEEAGMEIVHEAHALRRGGQEYFGLLQVDTSGPMWADVAAQDDYCLITGLRNSHIKSFSAGLCMGSQVFICDNLCFSGQVTIKRKHSRNILRDMPAIINRAVGQLGCLAEQQELRLEAYKETRLSDMTVRDFVVRAMEKRVIGCTLIPKVLQEWHRPRHEEFAEDRNAWRLFNGFTEVLKARGLFDMPERTMGLHALMDLQCGVPVFKSRDRLGIEAATDVTEDDTIEVAPA